MAETAQEILQKYWGYKGFRGQQAEIIRALVSGSDAVALLPTGGGKSLCYQVPGLVREGLCLVISPLIALMEDQITDLKGRGIRAMGLFGRLPEEQLIQRLDNAAFGGYDFLYLSPERLRQDTVLKRLEGIALSLIAVDEAHCISQWGFDFRPAYLECARLRERFPEVPLAAFTATAPPEVLTDIRQVLHLEAAPVFRDSVARPNLQFRVIHTQDKRYRLQAALRESAGSAIVYVQTRRASTSLAAYLNQQGLKARYFHGGMQEAEKKEVLAGWQNNTFPIVVATNAFGMGIDKADVRTVVHYETPETLEHYYQEAGRAGRDGAPARALLLIGPSDAARTREFYLGSLPEIKDLVAVYRHLCNYFQVAYGELPETVFSFPFEAFCGQYKLPSKGTFQALEVLDRQGLISLRPLARTQVSLQMDCSKAALWEYLERVPAWQGLVQTVLRTYGGVFEYPTEIRLGLLAKKLQQPEVRILEGLRLMEKEGLVLLEVREGDLQLQFLQPREDARSIHAFAGAYSRRQEVKIKKVEHMLAYAALKKGCRRSSLLEYFGETTQGPCGNCDLCLPLEEGPAESEGLRKGILQLLGEGPKTSREIQALGSFPETQLLELLRLLLEEGRIALGPANEYKLTKP
ncbi:RecQ family ATP-dependent DNA helicase [Robiginitalea sp. M366]|uniref:RecQ family ATP-dependent DNA helicase n=1 Tax=Robiginitalea aestuariiviva TaxID=3036903 RepID=UPI00240CE89F|nr:ATP-dependent DNA helicase RecQ [Robiginitalea aestuariiviva]MDG1572772.1 RecQ family ATP-dependent DNA helicase [Robiginitalea aestuariiviva]